MIVCGLSAAEVRFLAVETTSPLSRSTTAASSFVPPKSMPSACRFAISAPFLAWPDPLSRVSTQDFGQRLGIPLTNGGV